MTDEDIDPAGVIDMPPLHVMAALISPPLPPTSDPVTTQILHAIGSEWQNDATELQKFFDGLPDEDERAMMHADASDALFCNLLS